MRVRRFANFSICHVFHETVCFAVPPFVVSIWFGMGWFVSSTHLEIVEKGFGWTSASSALAGTIFGIHIEPCPKHGHTFWALSREAVAPDDARVCWSANTKVDVWFILAKHMIATYIFRNIFRVSSERNSPWRREWVFYFAFRKFAGLMKLGTWKSVCWWPQRPDCQVSSIRFLSVMLQIFVMMKCITGSVCGVVELDCFAVTVEMWYVFDRVEFLSVFSFLVSVDFALCTFFFKHRLVYKDAGTFSFAV